MTIEPARAPSLLRSPARPLDLLNATLVDVNGAIKPYLAVYLYARHGWANETIGLVNTIAGLFGIAAQAPAGAAIDATHDKRLPLVFALVVLSIGPTLVGISPHFWPVLVGSLMMALVAGLLSPAVAAITVAITPPRALTRRLGRNAAWDRAGNVAIAVGIGLVGWLLPDRAVFLLVPALCVVCAGALFSIPRGTEDESRLTRPDVDPASRWRILATSRPLRVFAICTGAFHFANAPLLTLVAQEVSRGYPHWASLVTSLCIVGAQLVMVPMAIVVGRLADSFGRKPLLVVAFVALALRAVLYTASRDPVWLVGVQLLDGVGNGLLSAAKPVVVADLMRGTGHYNLALGLVGTLQAVGAALSFVVAGTLAQHFGFDIAYLACGAIAVAALVFLVLRMPETGPMENA